MQGLKVEGVRVYEQLLGRQAESSRQSLGFGISGFGFHV